MLRLHIAALAALPTSRISAVLAVVPSDPPRTELPGYLALEDLLPKLRCPLEVIRVNNNTLGSYGMYLHAFAIHRALLQSHSH